MKNKYNIIILAFATLLFVFSSSCKKWDPTDLIYEVEGIQYSDGMSGFGNNDAEIEGTEFSFPEGIILAEEVAGAKSTDIPEIEKPAVTDFQNFVEKPIQLFSKSTPDTILGSGYYVVVLLPLRNTTTADIEVELPATLVFQNKGGSYQNGLLIKKVTFVVPANSTYNVQLNLYCCNLSRHASDSDAIYDRFVLCTNEPIIKLCELFNNKKVNIEEQPINYDSQVSKIQSIVWNLTQLGFFPHGEDLNWINSLPASN